MNILEKSMLFIPNRYSAQGKEIYVSYNISVIPEDMEVLSMKLVVTAHVPATGTLVLREIKHGWDEQYIMKARPTCTEIRDTVAISRVKEAEFDLTRLSGPWRFDSHNNHGIYVVLESEDDASFLLEDPPYLLVGTM
ncbi:hypothetical protein [Paenibacillus antibioticophila]|uniref:hypothetical protein n=1 Tax=Paenibacillus antibioticophila TaxID=1274374 RepID=UPI0005C92C7D|nr:hypothetical protein [Paenibacillus antibioticophila]